MASPYGDGSDGALNVTSGTANLALNTKHQFTSVNIAAGATLSTTSTTGSVLYILCNGTFTLDGTINVSGIVNRGNNTWSVTIDGDTFNSPGVANGGYGIGSSNRSQSNGFGGGGDGGYANTSPAYAGAGGAASGSTPVGGTNDRAAVSSVGSDTSTLFAGTHGGGGNGIAYAQIVSLSGGAIFTASAISGEGGSGFGDNGGSGMTGYSWNGVGAVTYNTLAGGGGGAGGNAGRAGVHVVIKAKELIFNGSIITSGAAGTKGGNGGQGRTHNGPTSKYGYPGGGGGGGNGGDVDIYYHTSLTGSGTSTRTGGAAGAGGTGGSGNATSAPSGTAGSAGTYNTYQLPDLTDMSLSGDLTMSGSIAPTTIHNVSIGGAFGFTDSINVTKVIAPVEGKDYIYRVYDSDNTYIGIWPDVADELEYSTRLNTPGTTTRVKLARSASTTKEVRETLTDETGDPITTEDNIELVAVSQTNNTIGEDTDVDLNYNVDIYAHYGSFEDLVTEDGELLITEDDENILVADGYPQGIRVFSGFIIDYEAHYGESSYVYVTLASHGYELSHEVIKSGSNTTVTYSTTSPETIVKAIIDTNPGVVTYSAESIEATGLSISQTFRLNTKLEGIETVYGQTDAGWYWFVDPGDNYLYLKETAATADHTFVFGKHIIDISLMRSMEGLVNTVYFVGGESTPGDETTTVYKKYEDATSVSVWRLGLNRITDRRYTVAASMQRRAEQQMNTYKEPIYTTTVSIPSSTYNIELIKLGQVVNFANFGNFVDDLLLQIVGLKYTPYVVTLDLGGLLERQADIIDGIERGIQDEQFMYIPNAPS